MARTSVPLGTDFYTSASPGPRPLARTYAIFMPFDPYLWACVVLSVPVIGVVLQCIAVAEGMVHQTEYHPWDKSMDVFWYVYV